MRARFVRAVVMGCGAASLVAGFVACESAPSAPQHLLGVALPPRSDDPGGSDEAGVGFDVPGSIVDASTRRNDDGGTGKLVDSGIDAAPSGVADFVDLFLRTDHDPLGNGWVEKKAGIYEILNAAASMKADSQPFYDSFVSRTADAEANVSLSVDFTYPGAFDDDPAKWPDPALYGRVQADSATVGSLSAYTFYAYPDVVGITREQGQLGSVAIATSPIDPPLEAGQTYHLQFVIKGTGPVQLQGILSKGATPIQNLSTTDNDANAINGAGTYGFGAGIGAGSHWDNFKRVALQ